MSSLFTYFWDTLNTQTLSNERSEFLLHTKTSEATYIYNPFFYINVLHFHLWTSNTEWKWYFVVL